jgi:tetratricopeptide (TPR) repeat protein
MSSVIADDDSDSAETSEGTVTSVDALRIGHVNSRSLSRAAEYCMQNEQYDKAIKLSRMALDRDSDDNETHQVYAEALEGKLKKQTERDPSLFNECVKEWLVVLRQEAGDEKLTYHGIGIPILGQAYQDEDRVIPARKHLMKLTGHAPKVWETDDKFLKKVLLPTKDEVYGNVMRREAKTHSPKTADADFDKESGGRESMEIKDQAGQ